MLDDVHSRIGRWRRRRDARRAERADRHIDQRLGLVPTRTCRLDARSVYVGDDTLLCRVQGRFFLYVPSRDANVVPALANFGRIDPWLSRVIAQVVRPGMTVADVGANVGYFTMQLADQVGPAGRVHAFEPNTDLVPLIRRSALANHVAARLTVHPHAVGAEDGREMWLCLSADALAGSAVHDDAWRQGWMGEGGARSAAGEHDGRDARSITLCRLDSLSDAGRIAVVKIDVEGFEPDAWAGMAGLLAGDTLRTVVMEYTPEHYGDAPAFAAALFRPGWNLALIDPLRGPAPISLDAVIALPPTRPYDLLLTR